MGKHDQESAAVGARRATGAATGRGRGGRFSAGRRRETVLRLLRGEDLESVSRELGITAARASRWRDQFLAAGRECPTGSRKSAATVNTSYPTFCISATLSSSRSRCAFSIQRCS